jgi:hypothetical protein
MVVYSIASKDSLSASNKWMTGKLENTDIYIYLPRHWLMLSCDSWHLHFLIFLIAVRGAQKGNQSGGQIIGLLVGNKSDLREVGISAADSRAEVSMVEAQNMAANMTVPYFETSAVSVL